MNEIYTKPDKRIASMISDESARQKKYIRLIPSENYVSKAVAECLGSVFMNKYSEGYPGRRYYEGQDNTDRIETLAQNEIKQLFGVGYANVQAHSGSPAVLSVYNALLEPGAKIMGLALQHGGHLTHGYKVSATSRYYTAIQYEVDPNTLTLNYDTLESLAMREKPAILVAGGTAYPRAYDFKRMAEISRKCGAYFLADISHISGFVARGLTDDAVQYADVVVSTTHKLLRGPRGAVILTNNEDISKKINKSVFPGLQGGPHIHTIAGIAQMAIEDQTEDYKVYLAGVLQNAKIFEEVFRSNGVKMVSGGTDTHLLLIDTVSSFGISGKDAAVLLYGAGIELNANTIPFDPNPPLMPSGIRLGTPAITTVGATTEDCKQIAGWICEILSQKSEAEKIHKCAQEMAGGWNYENVV